MPTHFFSEETPFVLKDPAFYSNWIHEIFHQNSKNPGEINYIFCSDSYLLNINQEHLNHDFFTDIITFDNSESDDLIEADIYISIDRVKENSEHQGVTFENELSRVMAHGLLHLFGYKDQTDEEKRVMREKEDACISLQKK